jgi:uncharacterized phiE125 gp8 family phage protein
MLIDVKNHCRITFAGDDSLLRSYLEAAFSVVQEKLWRQLITATITMTLDRFPADCIRLPRPPAVSVTSVTYLDAGGTSTVWDASSYIVDVVTEPGRICLAESEVYPTVDNRITPITIVYTAGFGTTKNEIPTPIRTAIAMLVHHWYSHRLPVESMRAETVPMTVDYLLSPWEFRDERVISYV